MNKQILASLILATLTTSAFALPGKDQPPLTEVKAIHNSETLSENGSERTKAFRVAEGGADRLIESRRMAEGGAERTKAFRVAEGGSDRLIENRRVAEGGAERTKAFRTA